MHPIYYGALLWVRSFLNAFIIIAIPIKIVFL